MYTLANVELLQTGGPIQGPWCADRDRGGSRGASVLSGEWTASDTTPGLDSGTKGRSRCQVSRGKVAAR